MALENIRILKDEKLVERVHDETGPYLDEALQELLDHPLVGEVRKLGLIGAIELVKDKKTRRPSSPSARSARSAATIASAIGLVMRATRDTMLISPPLIWTKADIDEFVG